MATKAMPSWKMIKGFVGLCVLGAVAIAVWLNWPQLSSRWEKLSASPTVAQTPPNGGCLVELVPEEANTVRLDKQLLETPRFTVAKVEDAPAPEPLRLNGSIIPDNNRLARIHSLFAGQIVKVGLKGDMSKTSANLSITPDKGLHPNDYVKKDQILAVVWCKDVGEKKSELVDQTSQMAADKKVLERYLSVEKGVISLNALTVAIRAYMQDVIAVNRAERTLRSWQLTDEEIDAVKREAEKTNAINDEVDRIMNQSNAERDFTQPVKLPNPNSTRDKELERSWAEVAIRAPFDGRIVEMSVALGNVIDPTVDLFKIAKLDKLQVMVHPYEEDLIKLRQLERQSERADYPQPANSAGIEAEKKASERYRAWKISYQANSAVGEAPGYFESLSSVIDPAQHAGSIYGWVENPDGMLFIGQNVTATVQLPPDPDLVAVPTDAVVEDAEGSSIFVRTGDKDNQFTRRKIAVAVRGREKIFLRKTPTAFEAKDGAEAIKPGEIVLNRGALDIASELENLQSQVSRPGDKVKEEKPKGEKAKDDKKSTPLPTAQKE